MKKTDALILAAAALSAPAFSEVVPHNEPHQSVAESVQAQGLWIDVRSPEEFQAGHLHNAVNIPLDKIVEGIKAVSPDKNAPLNLYCRSGRRSEAAMLELKKAGYTRVTNQGGYEDLLKKGLK